MRSINCVQVYSIRNVTERGGMIINGTHALTTLQIAAISPYTSSDLHPRCHLKGAHLTCLHQHSVSIKNTPKFPSLTVWSYYLFRYHSRFCPSKDTRSVLLKMWPCLRQKDGRGWDKAENQMTRGYLISSGALEIGVRRRCQRLHGVFIGSAQKLIRSAIFERLLGRCYFQFKALWAQRREQRHPGVGLRQRPVENACFRNVMSPLPHAVSLALTLIFFHCILRRFN